MPNTLLTIGFIKQVRCPADKKQEDYSDTKRPGLKLKVFDSGLKTYYLRYKTLLGSYTEAKIGDASVLSLTEVRELATLKLSQLAQGIDPFSDKRTTSKMPKFGDFVRDEFMPYITLKNRSPQTEESLLRNHIIPVFGNKHLKDISREDISELMLSKQKTHAPASVQRLLITMRHIFNRAIEWHPDWKLTNPARSVPSLEINNKKERYLSNEETEILMNAVKKSPNKVLPFIIGMLLLTGARRGEVLHAKWEDFDMKTLIWRIPMSKSGKARHVPISTGVINILETIPRIRDCPYIFANPKTKKPFVQPFCAWDSARKKAGLSDVRIHDLRHSFASFLVNAGKDLYVVQKILGHTQVKTTQRYAHLSQNTLLAAANDVSMLININPCQTPANDEQLPKAA